MRFSFSADVHVEVFDELRKFNLVERVWMELFASASFSNCFPLTACCLTFFVHSLFCLRMTLDLVMVCQFVPGSLDVMIITSLMQGQVPRLSVAETSVVLER